MPPIRSLAFKYHTYIVALILLLSVIIPIYSCYTKKGLVCIIITALFGRQLSSYSKYTKSNMCSSYNIKLVFNTKYTFYTYLTSL